MRYWHIPQSKETKIQPFYKETFNAYLKFHRPCGFLSASWLRQAGATKTVDVKGKIKKKYETYLTPFEKYQSLLNH